MKVTIKITEKGYSKTLKMPDGTKHVQKWRNVGNGFQTTDDSVKWDDLDLTDDFKDAIEDFDFSLGDLSNAIETESAELPWDDGEAITNDGVKLNRGDSFWSVAVVAGTWENRPLKNKFPQDWGICGSETYASIDKCWEVCEEYNKAKAEKKKKKENMPEPSNNLEP